MSGDKIESFKNWSDNYIVGNNLNYVNNIIVYSLTLKAQGIGKEESEMLLERIKKLCEEKHMSIAGLEKAAGIANATIRTWDKSNPRIDTLQKVAAVLECSINDLISKE